MALKNRLTLSLSPAIWLLCGDRCGLEAGGRHRETGCIVVATGKRMHGGFLVCRGRVTRASPYVRRYIHILAMRNAEYWGDPFAV